MSGFVYGLVGPHARRQPVARRRLDWARLAAPVAAAAGGALRLTVPALRQLPSVAGAAALVMAGFTLTSWVGWAVLGVVLLALDRRTAS